jgi:predicted nuclease of predicted toxin-antitoxin system
MILWTDAQLSPAIAQWITANFPIQAVALRELGLRDASDRQIFEAAKQAGAVVMTKDSDFAELVNRYGPPPQVIWLTCGHTSNARLKQILTATLSQAIDLLQAGESLVEIAATT